MTLKSGSFRLPAFFLFQWCFDYVVIVVETSLSDS